MRVSVPEPLRHGGERSGLIIAYGIILAMLAFVVADMVFLFTGR
jgi:hypothetical protein